MIRGAPEKYSLPIHKRRIWMRYRRICVRIRVKDRLEDAIKPTKYTVKEVLGLQSSANAKRP